MRKKKIKKEAHWTKLLTPMTPEEIRERMKTRQIARKRHAKYSEQPLRSVRGINKERGCCCTSGSNGTLCLACLRSVQTVDTCNHCGSSSLIRLESKCRKPPRKASRQHWIRFIRKWTFCGKYILKGVMPEDFMDNVRRK